MQVMKISKIFIKNNLEIPSPWFFDSSSISLVKYRVDLELKYRNINQHKYFDCTKTQRIVTIVNKSLISLLCARILLHCVT